MRNVTLTIDGQEVSVPRETTILQAARKAGIHIPTLCYLEGINEVGACRMCVVEVEGRDGLVASCIEPVKEGMVVNTATKRVFDARRTNLELLLSDHPYVCASCGQDGNCALQDLADELDISMRYTIYTNPIERYRGATCTYPVDESSPSIVRDPTKCVHCYRCVSVCEQVQTVCALGQLGEGFDSLITGEQGESMADSECINCGQCVVACPTGALTEHSEIDRVRAALADPDTCVIVQTAPSVRVAVGEPFGLKPGSVETGRMVAALRKLGFDRVFDTNFGADATIVEEASELVRRLKSKRNLPMTTSCCPGWIKFAEQEYPDLLDCVSTAKSPHEMFGAMAKSYYERTNELDGHKVFCVSVMPCTAKKFEIRRPELDGAVDAVLTTRELARMLKDDGIDLAKLEPEPFDAPLGTSTGAAAIFGATGGVAEAALRTAYFYATGKELDQVEFVDLRGMDGVKTASVDIDGTTVKVGVAHGLGNARKLLDKVCEGDCDLQFIEVMACPGGCINGGGQPYAGHDGSLDAADARRRSLYAIDEGMPVRVSHANTDLQRFYKDYIGKPYGRNAHALLHTAYAPRA
jgi:NADP-reducing hydrogenase subunit HndD